MKIQNSVIKYIKNLSYLILRHVKPEVDYQYNIINNTKIKYLLVVNYKVKNQVLLVGSKIPQQKIINLAVISLLVEI